MSYLVYIRPVLLLAFISGVLVATTPTTGKNLGGLTWDVRFRSFAIPVMYVFTTELTSTLPEPAQLMAGTCLFTPVVFQVSALDPAVATDLDGIGIIPRMHTGIRITRTSEPVFM
jgi:hypothetical protein